MASRVRLWSFPVARLTLVALRSLVRCFRVDWHRVVDLVHRLGMMHRFGMMHRCSVGNWSSMVDRCRVVHNRSLMMAHCFGMLGSHWLLLIS